MTPPARIQAAIELLDQITAAARDNGAAADTLVQRYFATRRYAGSKDRRAVRELVFAAIRGLGERPESGRAAMLALAAHDEAVRAGFDGVGHGPAPIADGEPVAVEGIVPAWLAEQLVASGLDSASFPALVDRAPLDVRVNTPLSQDELAVEGEAIPGLPDALRLPAGTDLRPLGGRVEVQDAGSQVVTLAARAQAGETLVDLCAGAGGKSLALAAAMANYGRIVACDVDRTRLSRLAPRAAAANATIIETRLLNPGQEAQALADLQDAADTVFVDAPCSGTGTWRRNPEARWRLTPGRLERLAATQRQLLDLGAMLVRPRGALLHVVCSLLDQEGRDQADRFLVDHPGWRAEPLDLPLGRPHGPGWRLDPAHDGSDGFFVARLIRPC